MPQDITGNTFYDNMPAHQVDPNYNGRQVGLGEQPEITDTKSIEEIKAKDLEERQKIRELFQALETLLETDKQLIEAMESRSARNLCSPIDYLLNYISRQIRQIKVQ